MNLCKFWKNMHFPGSLQGCGLPRGSSSCKPTSGPEHHLLLWVAHQLLIMAIYENGNNACLTWTVCGSHHPYSYMTVLLVDYTLCENMILPWNPHQSYLDENCNHQVWHGLHSVRVHLATVWRPCLLTCYWSFGRGGLHHHGCLCHYHRNHGHHSYLT